MNSLSIIWQVLFKGFQELQNGFHLYQHGEMIILRLIFISDNPNPENLIKESWNGKKNQNQLETKNKEIQKENNINNDIKPIIENNIKETTNNSSFNVSNFRQFVDLFYIKREALMHAQLYNSVKLISFKEGEVFINTGAIRDQHFTRNIAKLISKWTGRIWQIHSSESNIGSSLSEEDIVNQQNEIKIMKKSYGSKKYIRSSSLFEYSFYN